MAKQKFIYVCTECAGQALKWQGQCPHCQAWNTLIETLTEKAVSRFSPVSEIGQVQNLSTIEAREEAPAVHRVVVDLGPLVVDRDDHRRVLAVAATQ